MKTGRCFHAFNEHSSGVTCVAITPDGKKAVSGGRDKTIRLWNLENRQCIAICDELTESLKCISITPDGNRIISACGDAGGAKDKSLRVWDFKDNQFRCVNMLKGHTHWVNCVEMTADGKKAVSVGGEGHIFIWSIEDGKCDCIIRGHHSTDQYSHPITSISLTSDGEKAITGDWDGCFRVWNLKDRTCVQTKKMKDCQINSVSITPDGKSAVSGDSDCLVRFWDVSNGQCIKSFKGHSAEINSIKITIDAARAISASGGIWESEDKTLRLWNLHARESETNHQKHDYRVSALYITPDGHGVISGSCDQYESIKGAMGDIISSVGYDKLMMKMQSDLVLPGIGEKQAVPFPIRLWDTTSRHCVGKINLKNHVVAFIVTTPDGKKMITGGGNQSLYVWNIESGEVLYKIKAKKSQITSALVTPDGQQIIAGGLMGGGNLCAFDLNKGEKLFTFKNEGPYVLRNESVAISPDGACVIAGNINGEIYMWDLVNSTLSKTLRGHSRSVTCLCIAPDCKFAVSGSYDNTIRIWELSTGWCLNTIKDHADAITSIAITPDGRKIISSSHDKTLRVWDIKTGICIAAYQAENPITAISGISTNGIMAYGMSNGEIVMIQTINLLNKIPAVTPIRLWKNQNSPFNSFLQLFFSKANNKGWWEDHSSTRCSYCHRRFPVPDSLNKSLKMILKRINPLSLKSPCLELPTSTWEHKELEFECPFCNNILRLNPFIVDNKNLKYKVSFSFQDL